MENGTTRSDGVEEEVRRRQVMNIQKRKVSELVPNAHNPRVLKETAIDAVSNSIKEFGYLVPIVIDENNMILAGHTRLEALKKQNIKEVEVVLVDTLTDEQKRLFNIVDNKTNELNDWDETKLAELIKGVEDQLTQFGFTAEEMNELFEIGQDSKDEDDCPIQAPPICKLGDKWKLGNHILVCGDSTKEETYDLLLGDEKVEMVFTDPPYNVAYESKSKDIARKDLENDNIDVESFKMFLKDLLVQIDSHTTEGASYYICSPTFPKNIKPFVEAIEYIDYTRLICWHKGNQAPFNDGRYRTTYEGIFYCVKNKAKSKWNLKTTEIDVWKIAKQDITTVHGNNNTHITITTENEKIELVLEGVVKGTLKVAEKDSDFWQIKRDNTRTYVHPTQKPVVLIERALHNSSDVGGIIMDCFGGSGSTMMACEKTKRVCRTIELDPIFCDVIIKRWENYTNGKAEKVC